MPFEKGQSGNPAGRKPGSSQQKRFCKMIESEIPALVDTVITKAKGGDMVAMKLCIDRLFPLTRPRDERIKINGIDSDNMLKQVEAIFSALSKEELTANEANHLLGAISRKARIIETNELMDRVTQLELFMEAKCDEACP